MQIYRFIFVAATATFCLPTFAKESRPFASATECREAIEQNSLVTRFDKTGAGTGVNLIFEIIELIERTYGTTKQIDSCTRKLMELLESAVALSSNEISEQDRNSLRLSAQTMWRHYSRSPRLPIVTSLYDRFWLWSSAELPALKVRLRNDTVNYLATQLIWILENATPEERAEFFKKEGQDHSLISGMRWFSLALQYKFGNRSAINFVSLVDRLGAANPKKIRPDVIDLAPHGFRLSTSLDLYTEVVTDLQFQARDKTDEWFSYVISQNVTNPRKVLPSPSFIRKAILSLDSCSSDLRIDD